MNEKQLRRIIREEVESVMTEAARGVPDTFTAFRKKLNAAMKKVPELWKLLDPTMKDTGYEGDLVQPMWDSWMEMEYELESAKKTGEDLEEIWREMLPDVLHDMFIDLGDVLGNPWNFPPGAAPERPDSETLGMLGMKVADIMVGRDPDYREKHAARGAEAVGPVAQAIIDDLHGEGARVKADIKNTFATIIVGVQRGTRVADVLAYVDEGFTQGRYGPTFTSTEKNVKNEPYIEDPEDTFLEWKSENIMAWVDDQTGESFVLAIDYTGG